MEREWKLGVDLSTHDNLLDGVTFDDLILAVQCNCPVINRATVHTELNRILSSRTQDMMHLLQNNMEEIMKAAKQGRG